MESRGFAMPATLLDDTHAQKDSGVRGRTDMPRIVDWYMDGKIEIDSMITHILPLDRVNEGFDLMHAGKSIRAVVVC
jgi:Zn-dependent alcohol dehydrogenase